MPDTASPHDFCEVLRKAMPKEGELDANLHMAFVSADHGKALRKALVAAGLQVLEADTVLRLQDAHGAVDFF